MIGEIISGVYVAAVLPMIVFFKIPIKSARSFGLITEDGEKVYSPGFENWAYKTDKLIPRAGRFLVYEIKYIILKPDEDVQYWANEYGLEVTPKGNLYNKMEFSISEANLYFIDVPFWKKNLLLILQEFKFPVDVKVEILILRAGGVRIRYTFSLA